MLRALWALLLSGLMLAILRSESADSETLACAGLGFMGLSGLILLGGHFVEGQYNQLVRNKAPRREE